MHDTRHSCRQAIVFTPVASASAPRSEVVHAATCADVCHRILATPSFLNACFGALRPTALGQLDTGRPSGGIGQNRKDAKYTASGDIAGAVYDGANQDGLAEVKTGESELSSSYQRRLEVYGAVVNDTPLTIYTGRLTNPTCRDYLTRLGLP